MRTQRISDQLEFEAFDGRRVVAGFDGGAVTSDAGALVLREADRTVALIDRVVACFADGAIKAAWCTRCAPWSASGLLRSRSAMRTSTTRSFSERLEAKRRDCASLAGKSTINRLEHAPRGAGDRYHM
jgi:hypothetical protein